MRSIDSPGRWVAVAAAWLWLLTGVAMPSTSLAQCLGDGNGDGEVTIDEIVAAVNNALGGCAGTPTGASAVVANYAALLYANYSDTEAAARRLQVAVDEFVAQPSQVLLDTAKAAWLSARPIYQQSEIGRFYEGPIDNEASGPEGRINAWPLDESFIDYVVGNPSAGIINAVGRYPSLSAELIAGLNESGGETNIATGWHAVEFLLWGQDRSPIGPGNRPYTDYVIGAGGTAANQARRGQYLKIVAKLLADDLASVKEQWAPGRSDNYRAAFIRLDPKIALAHMLTGIGTLSGFELSHERMQVALDTQDQEDEHSCFSDNTHVDHRYDQIGIQNVYLGRYGDLDGPGIDELVRAVNPSLDAQLQSQLAVTLQAIRQIPVPYDQAIFGSDATTGRQAIIAALGGLRAETRLIEDVAAALGVDITTN